MINRKAFVLMAVVVSVAGLIGAGAGLFSRPAVAGNLRVITIHDRGTDHTIATDATSVGDALKRAGIGLSSADAVEPVATTELSAPAYTVNVYRARPVTVIDGTSRTVVMSPYQSPRSIVSNAGIQLFAEDNVSMQRIDDFVADDSVGLRLEIKRATPVNLVLYGTQTLIRTNASTVGQLLVEKHITLGKDDGTSLPAATKLSANMILDVWRNGVQTKSEEQSIAFGTEVIQDVDKETSFKEIREAGVNGKKLVTFEVTLKNGQETSRKEIQTVVTQQPKKQVQVVGAKRPNLDTNFASALGRLRGCEAGGNYDRNSGNGYYGAYQYDKGTWANYGGYALPSEAPGAVQDAKAAETYQRRGWQPWPSCSHSLGLQDSYR